VTLLNNLPQKLTHFTLFVDGRGYAGMVDEIVLPKLTYKVEDYRAGGMDVPIPIEMGMEKLEAEFTLGEYDRFVIQQLGFQEGGPIAIHVRGALKRHTLAIPVSCHMRGVITEIDFGTWKAGETTAMKFRLYCTYYRYAHAEEVLVEIDADNMVRRINGVDQLAAVKAALLRG
jgi:P2 family phage contractile tail tube protein